MHRWGDSRQAWIGLWILAGLAMAGLNGYMLMSLLDEPLAGYSRLVRSVDRGIRQYRTLLAAKTENVTAGMDLITQRFPPASVDDTPSTAGGTTPATVAEHQVETRPAALPLLTGIVGRRSSDGDVSWLALTDAGVFAAGDTCRDFTVAKISAQGVSLVRGGQAWFLKAPSVGYSLTTP